MSLTQHKIKLKPSLKKIQDNGVVLLDQAIVSGGNFVLGILLTRYLGLESYGVYTLLWMIVLVGLSINQALITKPLLSFGPKYLGETLSNYLHSIHAIQWMFALMSGFVVLLLLNFSVFLGIELPDEKLLIIIPLIMTSYLLYDFYRKQFFVKNELKKPLILDSLLYGIQLLGLALLISVESLTLRNCFSVVLVSQAIVVLGMLNFYLAKFPTIQEIKNTFQKHFDFSKWLIGTAVLQWFSGNFFIIAGAAVLGVVTVGIIRMVQNIMGLTHILFLAMENIVPVRAAQNLQLYGTKGLRKYLKNNTMYAGAMIGAILCGIALFSPWILKLLYGVQYMEYSWVLVIFCGIYLFVFLSLPLKFALRTIELTKPMFIAYVLTTAFSLLAAYPFLEWWGISGLLVGLLLTNVINILVYLIFLRTAFTNYTTQANKKYIY